MFVPVLFRLQEGRFNLYAMHVCYIRRDVQNKNKTDEKGVR